MRINNTVVNGLFVYNSSVEYTSGDIVLYNGVLYKVLSSVTGELPTESSSFVEYLGNSTGGSPYVTESQVAQVLSNSFAGLTLDGLTPITVTSSTDSNINRSGVYETSTQLIVRLDVGSNIFKIVFTKSEGNLTLGSISVNDEDIEFTGVSRLNTLLTAVNTVNALVEEHNNSLTDTSE